MRVIIGSGLFAVCHEREPSRPNESSCTPQGLSRPNPGLAGAMIASPQHRHTAVSGELGPDRSSARAAKLTPVPSQRDHASRSPHRAWSSCQSLALPSAVLADGWIGAMAGEGTQNLMCAALAAAVLVGLVVIAVWPSGWPIDPIIALGIAAWSAWEGHRAWRGAHCF